jgi:hypothetical protein
MEMSQYIYTPCIAILYKQNAFFKNRQQEGKQVLSGVGASARERI